MMLLQVQMILYTLGGNTQMLNYFIITIASYIFCNRSFTISNRTSIFIIHLSCRLMLATFRIDYSHAQFGYEISNWIWIYISLIINFVFRNITYLHKHNFNSFLILHNIHNWTKNININFWQGFCSLITIIIIMLLPILTSRTFFCISIMFLLITYISY